MIDLVDCISVKSAEVKSKKSNALEIILKNERFLLFANTEREKDEWIGQVGKAIVNHSSMYVKDDDDDGDNDEEDEAAAR